MTVVLLHAGVCDRRMWDDVAPVLRDAGHAVVAPDLRGFGSRPLGHGPFSHAGDTLATIDALGDEPVDLVGASFGGRVALQVAARAPGRVRSLALLAPAPPFEWDFTDPALLEYAEAEEAAVMRRDLDAVAELNADFWGARLSPADRDYVAEAQRRALELGGEGADEEQHPFDPASITARALVMVGDADVADFVAISRRVAETLPGAELRVLEGAGHLLALERPDEVAAALAGWVTEE